MKLVLLLLYMSGKIHSGAIWAQNFLAVAVFVLRFAIRNSNFLINIVYFSIVLGFPFLLDRTTVIYIFQRYCPFHSSCNIY